MDINATPAQRDSNYYSDLHMCDGPDQPSTPSRVREAPDSDGGAPRKRSRFVGVHGRHWMHTVYQLDGVEVEGQKDLDRVCEQLLLSGKVQFFQGQVERCPRSGRIHLQLYEQWKQSVTGGRLAKCLGVRDSIHHDYVKDVEKARAYCCKEDVRLPDTKPRGFEQSYRAVLFGLQ